jgi:chromate transporter
MTENNTEAPKMPISSDNKTDKKAERRFYWDLFWTFSKIGAFTIGGGMAMIPLIQKEVVDKKHWINNEDFMDMLAISQSAPGLLAVNFSIFLGYKFKGVKGSIVATIASTLPSFIIILLIAMFFTGYQNNKVVSAIFKGIRPVVVSLIAVPVVTMAIQSKLNVWTGILAAGVACLIAFLHISPIYILLTVGVLAFAYAKYKDGKERKEGEK